VKPKRRPHHDRERTFGSADQAGEVEVVVGDARIELLTISLARNRRCAG
jgi:hypothetical protein